jgi:hypothetical protein
MTLDSAKKSRNRNVTLPRKSADTGRYSVGKMQKLFSIVFDCSCFTGDLEATSG